MKPLRRLGTLGVAGVLGLVLAVVAPAFACTGSPAIQSSSFVGPPGTNVELRLSGFIATADVSPVEIGWHSPMEERRVLASAPANTVARVTVPGDARPSNQPYFFVARQWRLSDGVNLLQASEPFWVTPPAPTLGYRLVGSDGGIFAFGDAGFFGSTGGLALAEPVVGMAATPSGNGYWLVGSDGGIFAFGDAGFFGSTGGLALAEPVVGMAATPSGNGYWLVGSDGGVFAFGDAGFFGSVGGGSLPSPIVGMTAMPTRRGYWLVAADGATYGFVGEPSTTVPVSTPSVRIPLARPIVGTTASPPGGYWKVASDGGIFAYEGAGFFGSTGGLALARPVTGMAATRSGNGYWLVGSDGGIFAFGDAGFFGSTGGMALAKPVVGVTATRG
jgi:hypothetical protein